MENEAEFARFMAKVVKEEGSGCWRWTASMIFNNKSGYPPSPMRYSWCRASERKLAQNVKVFNSCGKILCVNPEHIVLQGWTDSEDKRMRKTYGLSKEQYDKLLEMQGGVCKICGAEPKSVRAINRRLSVDHIHGTHKVRGLLCNRCNVAIGFMDEDISFLESAIQYLKSDYFFQE